MNPKGFKELLEKLVIDLGYSFRRVTYLDIHTGETTYAVRILKDGKPVTSTIDVPKETWDSIEILKDTYIDQNVPACAEGRQVWCSVNGCIKELRV